MSNLATVDAENNHIYPTFGGGMNFQKYCIFLADLSLIRINFRNASFQCLEHSPIQLHILLSGELMRAKTHNKIT